jgi:glycine dehydrogenase subunit 1
MLSDLGLSSVDDLFACVPEALRLAGGLDIPPGLSEPDVATEMARLARKNRSAEELVCFAGGGAYDHDVPAVTRALASRSEFVTAYTPYQPEVAQGVLQVLFEYQTLVSRLAGLPVANDSLYDGATALVEAVNLAAASTGRRTVWLSQGVNPRWRDVLRTLTAGTGTQIVDIALRDGQTDWSGALAGPSSTTRSASPAPGFNSALTSGSPPGAVVVASPNYLGCIDPIDRARAAADATGGA